MGGSITELVALRGAAGDAADEALGEANSAAASPTNSAVALADTVIDAFFNDLREEALHENEVLQESTEANRDAFSCKLNRQQLYLNEAAFAAALANSRAYLECHASWTSGRNALSSEELRRRVAMQHFTAVDFEDLGLSKGERRNNDTFTEVGVSKQFLLDVACSDFVIDGEEFSFQKEFSIFSGAGAETKEFDTRLRGFEGRLTTALLRCLSGQQHYVLVQAVTRAMSQAGVANLERACAGPQ